MKLIQLLVFIFAVNTTIPGLFAQNFDVNTPLKSADKKSATLSQVLEGSTYDSYGKGNIVLMLNGNYELAQHMAKLASYTFHNDSTFSGGQFNIILTGNSLMKNKKALADLKEELYDFKGRVWFDTKSEMQAVLESRNQYAIVLYLYGEDRVDYEVNRSVTTYVLQSYMAIPDGLPRWLDEDFDKCPPENAMYTCSYENQGGKDIRNIYHKDGWLYSTAKLSSKYPVLTDGEYTGYYKSGAVFFTKNMKEGLLDGKVTEYYESGAVMSESEYKDGTRQGILKGYYEDGSTFYVLEFKDGLLWNVLSQFARDGSDLPSGSLRNGSGERWRYYLNGNLLEKISFKKGIWHGDYTYYDSTGIMRAQTTYKDGLQDGFRFDYDSLGVLKKKTEFQGGFMHGTRELFYPNGKVNWRHEMKEDYLDGLGQCFNTKGEPILSCFYNRSSWTLVNNLSTIAGIVIGQSISGRSNLIAELTPPNDLNDILYQIDSVDADTSDAEVWKYLRDKANSQGNYASYAFQNVSEGYLAAAGYFSDLSSASGIEVVSTTSNYSEDFMAKPGYPKQLELNIIFTYARKTFEATCKYDFWGGKVLYLTDYDCLPYKK